MLFSTGNIYTQQIFDPRLEEKQLSLSVVRFDQIHPVVSGNKLFKLNYFLQQADGVKNATVVTFGGAYSNHLIATAFSCRQLGLRCIGIVRGEQPAILSPTLIQCLANGMELKFIPRTLYNDKTSAAFLNSIINEFPEAVIIPEGGYDQTGTKGASLMYQFIDSAATHICCAIGTATTIAGILTAATANQKIIGLPVLKGLTDIPDRINFLTKGKVNKAKLIIADAYHFGGYAKKNEDLIAFMNQLYSDYQLPTDFVYTAKLMYAIFDLIQKDFFEKGSNIHCLHTGGLQGNASLSDKTLIF